MKSYKAIIYDIDGTLLDTRNMNLYPLIRIIKEETGEDWAFEDVLKFVTYTGMEVMEELPIRDKEKTYARWVQYVNEYEEGASIYEGVLDVLKAFQSRHVLQAIASSKTNAQYQIDFVQKGLDQYISAAVLADDTSRHKPDPDPLLECLKRLGISAEDALYVGDGAADCQAAKRAGIDFGYAKWGSVSEDGIDAPDYIFEVPGDLMALF